LWNERLLEQASQLGSLPFISIAGPREKSDRWIDPFSPLGGWRGNRQELADGVKSLNDRREPPCCVCRSAFDTREWGDATNGAERVVFKEGTSKDAVDPAAPRVLVTIPRSVGVTVVSVKTPPRIGIVDELDDVAHGIDVQAKAPLNLRQRDQRDDRACAQPWCREVDHCACDSHEWVRSRRGPIRNTHAQVRESTGAIPGRRKRSSNEWTESFEIGSHDDNIARLKRRVRVEEMEDRISENFRLARSTMARMDLNGPIGSRGNVGAHITVMSRRWTPVRANVGLKRMEQRRRLAQRWFTDVVHGCRPGSEEDLKLPALLRPRTKQRMGRNVSRIVLIT
jgi:hypothetical protein